MWRHDDVGATQAPPFSSSPRLNKYQEQRLKIIWHGSHRETPARAHTLTHIYTHREILRYWSRQNAHAFYQTKRGETTGALYRLVLSGGRGFSGTLLRHVRSAAQWPLRYYRRAPGSPSEGAEGRSGWTSGKRRVFSSAFFLSFFFSINLNFKLRCRVTMSVRKCLIR